MTRRPMRFVTEVFVLCFAAGAVVSAARGEDPQRTATQAIAVLRRHCVECHGPQRQEAGLRLDSRAAAITGGHSGPALVAGSCAESELLRRVGLARENDEAMPPVGDGVAEPEIALLQAWVAAGADWPASANTPHWAYVAPVRHEPPDVDAAAREQTGDTVIDGWVAAGHAEQGLAFSPAAPPETLIRRLSFDLTGLPPRPEAVTAFLSDTSPDAYERLVDRLLASEEFGVRWARMWLDLARYADSHGYQRDDLRPLWAYRDWVVAALNADMPFDAFTIAQIAGDLLPDASEATRIATGFHRCAPTNVEAGTEPEESRFNQVIDRVNTTAAVWLGTTLECAQCHDHKYDPFTQADYYRLASYFNSTESEVARANPQVPSSITFQGPALALAEDPWAEERAELNEQIQLARESLKEVRAAKQVLEERAAEAAEEADAEAIAEVARSIQQIEKSLTSLEQRLADLPQAESLVMRELAEPRETFLLARGDLASPLQAVSAATPAVLAVGPAGRGDRLELAHWLVDPANPLTPRVIVNRVWHELFGRGIVTTLEDFGVKGEPPTHPELLDTLAVEFREGGWSLKRLIRRIVLSRTYQQTARRAPEERARDPENRWLARGPRFRLDAEAIRDNALAIAGLLSLAKGGPSIRPPQPKGLWTKVGGEKYDYQVSPGERQYRRGIYVVLKRGSPYPSFMTFDATSRMTCLVKRARSNTPLQALVLLNDDVYAQAAVAFAQRILGEHPQDDAAAGIDHAFRVALARPPSSGERDVLLSLLAAEHEALSAEPTRVAQRLAPHPQFPPPEGRSAEDLAAWTAVATAILNLDETITKP